MTNEEFDRRMDRLTERQEALAESVEMLNHGFVELSSIVRGNITAIKEQRERDKQYFRALARLLESWAGEDKNAQ